MGRHYTENCAAVLDDASKQALIPHQRLMFNMICLWINNSLTTNVNCKLRYFKSTYTFNAQYYGSAMFFVTVKMVRPDKCAEFSDIKSNLENMILSHFKRDIHKANLQIAEWMNEISIAEETYSEILRQKFILYSTSSCPLFKDYMETSRS